MSRRVRKLKISDRNAIRRGVGDIRTQINNISAAAQGQSIENALLAAAKPIRDEAKDIVTRDTNRLAMGITVTRLPIRKVGELGRVGVTVKNPPNAKFVANRWHWEEFDFKHRKKPLNPFFGPAYQRKINTAMDLFEKRLTANIAKALRGKMKLNKTWSPGSEN